MSKGTNNKIISPANKRFWEEFYSNHEFGQKSVFEWYAVYSDFAHMLQKILAPNFHVLHIGCGNSLLAEQILLDERCPENVRITNVDYVESSIQMMLDRQDKMRKRIRVDVPASSSTTTSATAAGSTSTRRDRRKYRSGGSSSSSSNNNNNDNNEDAALFFDDEDNCDTAEQQRRYRLLTEQLSYVTLDARHTPYEDHSFDMILDKGTLDALISDAAENGTGENQRVIDLISEMHRVVRVGGKYVIISGNDTFVTFPYFHSVGNWDVEVKEFVIQNVQNTNRKTFFFYILTACDDDAGMEGEEEK